MDGSCIISFAHPIYPIYVLPKMTTLTSCPTTNTAQKQSQKHSVYYHVKERKA